MIGYIVNSGGHAYLVSSDGTCQICVDPTVTTPSAVVVTAQQLAGNLTTSGAAIPNMVTIGQALGYIIQILTRS